MAIDHHPNGTSHTFNDNGNGSNGFAHNLGNPTPEPIAVIGLSLKFPQEATSAESFWEMLYEGRNAMTEFPKDRFSIDAFYDQNGGGAASLPLRGGHFLKGNLGEFDANFFSITPAEAAAMDPQQRMLLEGTYRALENAGLAIDKCSSSKTSVYTATFTDDYKSMLMHDSEKIPRYAATGLSGSMLANRISWFFNFHGPSMNLDSACSSSLSALHIACQDLLNGTSRMALVGGCNLVFHPDFMLIMSAMSFLSPDSRCWSFDHKANGYARGEGFGVVVLKKLSDALNDGDTIRGLIRATGLNQDGRTTGGITQPSGEAQGSLIRETFSRAKLDMEPVRFFEAHGTGTAIGDPTEAAAIGKSFLSFRSDEEPLYVGAVKSNIGHLEGGSGIAGLIKTLMILEKGIIPPNSGLEKINPRIDTQDLRIRFPTQPLLWPGSGLRRACVNSFGFGGSNAIVVVDDALHYLEQRGLRGHHRTVDLRLEPTDGVQGMLCSKPRETANGATKDTTHGVNGHSNGVNGHSDRSAEYPEESSCFKNGECSLTETTEQPATPSRPNLLVWSAADETGIRNMLSTYGKFFKQKAPNGLSSSFTDIAYTLAAKRSLHLWRSCVVATPQKGVQSLEVDSSKPLRASSDPKALAFVFTGQGAQYAKMGNGLLSIPFFRARIAELGEVLYSLGFDRSLLELLSDSSPAIDDPQYSQAFSTALQIAIVDYLKSIGIAPTAVVGHSSGEIAAAYCAGAISDDTALKIAFHRGRLARRLPELHVSRQGMMAVALSEEGIQPFLDRLEDQVVASNVQIGCVNSPKSITLTGDSDQLSLLKLWLKEKKHLASKLKLDIAYHSEFMNAMKDEYLESLRCLEKRSLGSEQIPMISSVTGMIIPPGLLSEPEYWITNLISQVKFSSAVSLLCIQSGKPSRKRLGGRSQGLSGITDLMEIGPHSTLQGPLQDILASTGTQNRIRYLSALDRRKDAGQSIMEAIGRLWCLGHPIDVLKANGMAGESRPVRIDLPEYPFNHTQKHWFEDRTSAAFRFRKHARHELLGTLVPNSNPFESCWRNFISLEKIQWAQDHQISGDYLLPGAGMLAMAIEAVSQLETADSRPSEFEIRDVYFLNVLQVPETDEGIETQVSLSFKDEVAGGASWYQFRVLSYTSEWVEHCRGSIKVEHEQRLDNEESEDSTHSSYHQQELSLLAKECTEEASSEQLYSVIKNDGVNYGPTFQVLHKVRFNKNGGAVADIREAYGTPGNKSKQLDVGVYTVHPSILDGLFQLVFPALNEGGTRDLPTMVPSHIERLTVYPYVNFASSKSHLIASTRSRFNGYHGTESTVVAMSPSNKKLFSVMEGYQTTFVSSLKATSKQDVTERPLLSNLVWRPDMDLLSSKQISQLLKRTRAREDSPQSFNDGLGAYLSNLAHKNPLMKVLNIGSTADSKIPCADLLTVQGQHQWLRYDYTEATSEQLAEAQSNYARFGSAIHYQILDIGIKPATQGFEEYSYDLVVGPHDFHTTPESAQALRNIRMFLKPGGKMILMTSQNQGWTSNALQENSLTGIDVSLRQAVKDGQGSDISINIVTDSDQNPPEALRLPEMAIITNGSSAAQSAFASRLKEQLETTESCEAIIYTFTEAVSTRAIASLPCIFLLEYEEPFLAPLSSAEYDLLKGVLALTKNILWVTKDTHEPRRPEFHMVDGLARVLRSEDPKLRFGRVAINNNHQTGLDGTAAVISVIRQTLHSTLDETESDYEERDGILCISRLVQSPQMNKLIVAKTAEHQERTLPLSHDALLVATLKNPGMLSSIVYEEVAEIDDELAPDEVVVQVRAVGLTSRDHQVASGRLNDSRIFSECSGVIKKAGSESGLAAGDKVFVSCQSALRTSLRCKASLAAIFPPSMSFAEAAALPTAMLLAYQALINAGNLQRGEVVLIHHAAGSVGQAAIQIARNIGAKIIVSASTDEKRDVLRATYGLSADSILSSKSLHLARSVLQVTANQGVDVVVNFETGDNFNISLEVLAPFGRLIDLGLATDAVVSTLTRKAKSKCITYTAIDLAEMQGQRPALIQKLFKKTSALTQSGAIEPAQPLKVFPASEIGDALKSFQNGRNVGKVVIDLSPDQAVKALVPNKPSYHFDADSTYLIAGGFGGLGRSVSRWMVERGAKNLIIISRSGMRSESASKLVDELTALGARVEAPACDIIHVESLKKVLAECARTLPPIRGCIQCTMVLRDAIFENMSYEDFTTGTHPKVFGSWNLHALLPKGMDFFVLLSSIAGIIGGTSQANYSAGNTYKDALARYRTSIGEKAASIDLGMMVDQGVVAETEGMLASLRRLGYFMDVREVEFLALLDHYCDPALPLLTPTETQIIVGIENPAGMEAKDLECPHWLQRPLFRNFRLLGDGTSSEGGSGKDRKVGVETMLRQSASLESATELVMELLVAKLSQVLGTPPGEMETLKPIHANGINSLAAVELRNWFDKKVGADVAVFEILGNMSAVALSTYAAGKSRFRSEV